MGAMRSLLITQCLQRDFVEPINRYDPLPNQLHVGAAESLRLLGERPDEGPLRRFMQWALANTSMPIIHIRDWHDADDEDQREHLSQFGPHCLKNTPGAAFLYADDMAADQRHLIVDASGLNDFHKTDLESMLTPYRGSPLRIGLIGVWTDAKILFLAYELTTRYPEFEVAICEALTASSSRSMHFIALEQMRSTLGVSIISSIGDFSSYLTGETVDIPIPRSALVNPEKLKFEDDYTPADEDRDMLLFLFRDTPEVHLKKLAGGFSGNMVLRARVRDIYGHRLPPFVVKLGERSLIAKEKAAFERIQEALGNAAPSIIDTVELKDRGAVKYRYAAMQGEQTTTFKKFYASTDNTDRIGEVLAAVFDDRLGRFYEAAVSEPLNLLDYYDFQPRFAEGIRKRVDELLPGAPADTIEVIPGKTLRHPALFYEKDLTELRGHDTREHFTGWVHGDLNGANIVLDSSQNVWIIDFFHTHRGHILRDLIKLENDLLYIFTELKDEGELRQAIALTDHLFSYEDAAAVPDALPGLPPALEKAQQTIRHLRSRYARLVQHDRDPYQMDCAMARYAIHTLSFDESSVFQKRWALYAASLFLQRIRYRLIETRGLRVDFLKRETPASLIGITLLPGRRDRQRELEQDLLQLQKQRIGSVLCLLSDNEFELYGVPDLLKRYADCSFKVMHAPVVDQAIPSFEEMDAMLAFVDSSLAAQRRILVHCAGGLGRSGTVAACYLTTRDGLSVDEAIDVVRESRSPRMVENRRQEDFVRQYTERSAR